MFKDREEAGRELAVALKPYVTPDTVVLALPRGGVPVAYEVSKRYGLPLDLYFSKKIPSPYNEEVAIGAISEEGSLFVNTHAVKMLGISQEYIDQKAHERLKQMQQKRADYGISKVDINGKDVILVDDGIATGATILTAIDSLKRAGAHKITVASPVAPLDIMDQLQRKADETVVLLTPQSFGAVGAYYRDFHQLDDKETIGYLE